MDWADGVGVNTSTSEFTPLRGWVLQYLLKQAGLRMAFGVVRSALAARTQCHLPACTSMCVLYASACVNSTLK